MREFWLAVAGFSNYQVSDQGNVRNKKTGKVLKPAIDHKGYLRVCLYTGKKKKNMKVHRLVAEAFLPNPDSLPEVDHIYGDRKDNRKTKLKWASKSVNTRNREVCRKATSKYNGVCYHKRSGKWRAMIWFKKTNKFLGHFTEEVEAALAFNKFCIENNLDRELNIIAEV